MALLGSDTAVTGPFPKGVLLLETLTGREMLGQPYVFDLDLLSRDPSLDPDQVLGKPMAVSIRLGTGALRYFHGVVTSFAKRGTTRLHTRYAATLEPALRQLVYAADCRVFGEESQNALRIVTAVLSERGITDFEAGGVEGHAFRTRELCVQYRETDLGFAQRLLEEEGIYYFFRHEETKHTLVLADSIAAHATVPGYETVRYTPEQRHVAGAEEHFWAMRVHKGLYPGRHTVLSGYDPTERRPRQRRFGQAASGEPAPGLQFEHYDYPGGLFDPEEASREATVRSQADHAEQTFIEVHGNTMALGPGDLVTVQPDATAAQAFPFWRAEDMGKQLLIVGATYYLSIDQYETGTVAGADEPFRATYQLLDAQTQYRPQRTVPKPRMGGPQTALVVGPTGEEIWTDKLGRVRVQFDWDRLGGRDEKSTCWVRVAQMWAGHGWGGIHVPRIGQEVLVRFLEGDPDRPIIAGALYDADNPPPYELPAHATQSGIKSRSSKGGTPANFNEIRFEDEKGAEELHLQAEKDMSTSVEDCQGLKVGANRDIVVGNDETNLVKANRDLTVRSDDERVMVKDSVVIGGAHDKTITGPVLQIYGDAHSRKVDGEQELVAERNKNERVGQTFTLTTDKKFQLNQDTTSMTFRSKNVTLDAGGEIVVTAGGAVVSIDQAGLTTFESPAGITLTCGGSSLAVLPGGVAISGPAFSAAAGGGSKMSLGSDAVAISSKKVTIEADGVCKLRGKKALKLQESEPVKAKKKAAGGGAGSGSKQAAGDRSTEAATAHGPSPPPEAAAEQRDAAIGGTSDAKDAPEHPRPVSCEHPPYDDIAQETLSFTVASRGYETKAKFDIRLAGHEVQIGVRIRLVNRLGFKPSTAAGPLPPIGPPVSPADKASMKADIEGKLSNKHLFHRARCPQADGCACPKGKGCCKIRVRIFVDFVESGEHHVVNLFKGPGRADSANWTRVKTRDNSYAHETGHLLGFYDEYVEGAVGTLPRWRLQSGVIMSTGLRVPPEYYWDFRDWLKKRCGNEDWTILPP